MKTARPERARFGLSFDAMAIGLLLVGLGFVALRMPAQSDTFWQLREGAEILATGHIPRTEHYSYTAAGSRYIDHEWLSEVLLAVGHRLGGMPGVALVAGAAVIGAMVLAYRLMVGPRLTRFAILAITLAVSSSGWVLRPQVFTLFGVALLALLLVRERLWFIPPLFLLWANAHGGVVVGWVLLIAAAAVTLIRRRLAPEAADRARLVKLALVVPVAALATLGTPLGVHLFAYVLETAHRGYALRISEWAPPTLTEPVGAAFWLVTVAFALVLVIRVRRFGRRPNAWARALTWGDWVLIGGALAVFPLAARSLRNVLPFLFLAGPAASRLLGADFRLGRRCAAKRPDDRDHPRFNLAFLGAASVAAVVALGVVWARGASWLDWRPIAPDALAALRACPGRLYNEYADGGYLIYFAPERPVFLDNRQDPYPLPLLLADAAVERGQAPYEPLFAPWGIRCAFLSVDSRLVRPLAAAGWTTRFRDDRWAVLRAPDQRARP